MELTEIEALKLLCIHVCVDNDRDMCTVRGLQTDRQRQREVAHLRYSCIDTDKNNNK